MLSLKFAFIEQNMKKMLAPLKQNQNLLRFIQYLSDFPLDLEVFDETSGDAIPQPDIVSTDLISDKIIIPTLFNTNIVIDSKVYLYFSPLRGNIQDTRTPIFESRYIFDIICPFASYVINGTQEFRPFRIANEICKSLDCQDVAGIGQVYLYDYSLATVNANYLGMRLFFKINDIAKDYS